MQSDQDFLGATDGSPDVDDELSTDSPTVEASMATATIKSEPNDEDDASTKPAYLSSLSFVNLVESIFVKKEDLKQGEDNWHHQFIDLRGRDLPSDFLICCKARRVSKNLKFFSICQFF